MVRQEWWTGVSHSRQAIIDFLKDLVNPVPVPNLEVIQETSAFSGSRDNYVAKFYGWVTVPETGTYQFHYACDDYGMLYVSQDEYMENAVEVAYVDGWCAVGEWNKYPSQHSAPMNLRKGQVMAVMAFFEEAGGGDNMDLGWTGPGLSSNIAAPTYLTNYITHIPPLRARPEAPIRKMGQLMCRWTPSSLGAPASSRPRTMCTWVRSSTTSTPPVAPIPRVCSSARIRRTPRSI